VGATDDLRLVEIAVVGTPEPLARPLLAKTAAKLGITKQAGALRPVLDMERLGSRADLFEHGHLHAVDPKVEGVWQRLKTDVPAQETVGQTRGRPDHAKAATRRLRVEQGDQHRP